MAIYAIESAEITELPATSFERNGLKERADLQRLLRDRIDTIVKDGMVLAEEFGDWDDARRRIDLLVLDRDANLVVVELKRTTDGGHMELQALRYAAMVSTMTWNQAVAAHQRYLASRGITHDAQAAMLKFLRWEAESDGPFASTVRIVLVSADFSKEITTTVLWLNDRGLDIRCVRLKPYEFRGHVLADVQELIPLPETADYLVKVRDKDKAQVCAAGRPWQIDSFLDALKRNTSPSLAQLARTVHDWACTAFPAVRFGAGAQNGAFGPKLPGDESDAMLFVVRTDGRVTLRLMHLQKKSWRHGRETLLELLRRLQQIPGIVLSEEDLGGKPTFPLEALQDPAMLGRFQETMEWLRDQFVPTRE